MNIYELVFGQDSGQVCCAFHDDTRESAGISDSGQYNCFACGAKAHNEEGFIMKYFNVNIKKASSIKFSLNNISKYKHSQGALTVEQRSYLNGVGIADEFIDKFFFNNGQGKLMFAHKFSGMNVGYTWFNNPSLPYYNASAEKYKYDGNTVAGMLTPYDDVRKYTTLILCEGEKDMLTAKSLGLKNAVAKIGGAITQVIAGVNLMNKNIVIVYDCDDAGRKGAEQDAYYLTEKFSCKVKVIDLGLQDKEDLNDYFIKHRHTVDDFYALLKATPIFVITAKVKSSRFQYFIDSLTREELDEVEILLQSRKGEMQNGNN